MNTSSLFLKATATIVVFLASLSSATAQRNSNDPCSAYSPKTDEQSAVQSAYTPSVIDRAKKLYRDHNFIVVTAHDHCYATIDFDDMRTGGITARTIKLTSDNAHWSAGKLVGNGPGGSWEGEQNFLQSAIDAIEQVKKIPAVIVIRSTSDIRRAKKEKKLGVIISFEGGAILPRRPNSDMCLKPPIRSECMQVARDLYKLGLRDFQPYWSRDNWLKQKPSDGDLNSESWPLNAYGVRVLQEMDRLGVAIDLSHMGPVPFRQALAKTHRPFILSHAAVARVAFCGKDHDCDALSQWEAGAKKEFGTPGNTTILDDNTIRAVVARRGVIALHFEQQFFPQAISSLGRATVRDLVDEIAYIKDNFGVDYVALGPDYIPSSDPRDKWIEGARNMTEIENVVKEMVSRKWSNLTIQKVMGQNLMRVYGAVWNSAVRQQAPTSHP